MKGDAGSAINRQASHEQSREPTADQVIRRAVTRLRLKFLVPLIGTLTVAITVVLTVVSFSEYRAIEGDVMELESRIGNLFESSLRNNARAMQSVLDVLKTDRELASALATGDRQRLLLRSVPVYDDINHHFGVTHFYFSGPDRVNLLRLHKREKYGDTIDRQTTLTAQESGEGCYGLELGSLGTLTLRYVQPWYEEETQDLIGFVELGMEVDQTLDVIFDSFGLDIFVLINKLYLDESSWKDGMQTFGKVADWDRFPHVVVSMHGKQVLPDALSKIIPKKCTIHLEHDVKPQVVSDNQYAVFHGLRDVSGNIVGTLVILIDVSRNRKHIGHTVNVSSGSLVMAAVVLVVFFYWLVGRIAERMARNELQLNQMATRDSLTGLFNRRQFNRQLTDSLERYERYGRPVALLMIDIDHFKQVNDKYGHPGRRCGSGGIGKTSDASGQSDRPREPVWRRGIYRAAVGNQF